MRVTVSVENRVRGGDVLVGEGVRVMEGTKVRLGRD